MFKKILVSLTVLTVFLTCTGCSKGETFDIAAGNITEQLENLGINNITKWDNSAYKNIISRIPYDMIVDEGTVYVSGGNYGDNTGPVPIYAYTNDAVEPRYVVSLTCEQINEFYQYDGFTFALAIDPRQWGNADLYFSQSGSGDWRIINAALKKNIHCYDMVKFKGNYYFCGSNIDKTTLNGKNDQEISKAALFKMEGDFDATKKSPHFSETFAKDKNGNIINYRSCVSVYKTHDGKELETTSVPRFYQFFEFNDKLLAFCFGSRKDEYDGLYVLNEENYIFEYSTEYNADFLIDLYSETLQDRSRIEHDFQWGDKYYFVTANSVYYTDDFKSYKPLKLNGFNGYTIHDALLKDDFVLCLASKEAENGKHTNVVLKTTDFESYTEILSFDSTLYAKSFEFCDGYFYFGLGFAIQYKVNSFNVIVGEEAPQYAEDCGTILRYKYK